MLLKSRCNFLKTLTSAQMNRSGSVLQMGVAIASDLTEILDQRDDEVYSSRRHLKRAATGERDPMRLRVAALLAAAYCSSDTHAFGLSAGIFRG